MSSKLTAVILLGTLKPASQASHTEALCQLLINELDKEMVTTKLIRLEEHNILPGVESDMGPTDDWPMILKQILAADIIIFATPIWWGTHSSLIQGAIERLDALHTELRDTGHSRLFNKVGGLVITGGSDGAEHVIGNIANFALTVGLTLPPLCALSYLGDFEEKTMPDLVAKFEKEASTKKGARTTAKNLAFFARQLKEQPMLAYGQNPT